MPGRPSQSKPLQYIGALVALIAIVGYVIFGWNFEMTDGPIPIAIGLLVAVVAIGWTLYQQLRSRE